MTSNRLRTTALLALVAVLAGCNTGGATPAQTSTSSPAESATPSPTTSPTPTPEQAAGEDAEKVARAYYEAVANCLVDPPNTEMTCFDEVAIATELNDRRNSLLSAQVMGTKSTGSIEIVALEVAGVDLTNNPETTPPQVPIVTFRVCRDVGGFNLTDKDGKSVVPADRPARGIDEVHVANYSYPDPTQWRVAFLTQPEPDPTC